jgi:hypothetical protein
VFAHLNVAHNVPGKLNVLVPAQDLGPLLLSSGDVLVTQPSEKPTKAWHFSQFGQQPIIHVSQQLLGKIWVCNPLVHQLQEKYLFLHQQT